VDIDQHRITLPARWPRAPRFPGYLAGQRLDGPGDVVQAERVRVHPRKREAAGLDQPDRLGVGAGIHAEGADHGDGLVDDQVAGQLDRAAALQPGQHHPAAPADRVQRVADGLQSHRRQLQHHVGQRAAGDLRHPRDGVLLLDVDRVVGAELPGEFQLGRVAGQAGHDDRVGPGGTGGQHRGEAALAGAEGPITGRGNCLISICRGPVCTAARTMRGARGVEGFAPP
jgi:hypothetical protein